jgi:hypothetical protein
MGMGDPPAAEIALTRPEIDPDSVTTMLQGGLDGGA